MLHERLFELLHCVVRKRAEPIASLPARQTRSSSRIAGNSALESNGLVDGKDGDGAAAPTKRALPAFPGPRPFVSSHVSSDGYNSSEGEEESNMLEWMRKSTLTQQAGSRLKQPANVKQSAWHLGGDRVLKMTRDGITHLSFLPTSSSLVLASGDKQGNVSIWRCPRSRDDTDESSMISIPNLHAEYISGLHWQGKSLITTSYDSSQPIRMLDVEAGVFALHSLGGEVEISAASAPSSDVLYLGTNEGGLLGYDIRSSSVTRPISLVHQKRLNSVEVDSSGSYLLTSSSDTTANVFDLRALDQPMHTIELGKSSHAARFSPSSQQSSLILTVSFDDTLRLWSFKGGVVEPSSSVSHNNNTGRWVLPFKPIFIDEGRFACGNMNRGINVYCAKKGVALDTLASDIMTAIPPRLAHHPSLPFLAAATSSGRAHIWEQA